LVDLRASLPIESHLRVCWKHRSQLVYVGSFMFLLGIRESSRKKSDSNKNRIFLLPWVHVNVIWIMLDPFCVVLYFYCLLLLRQEFKLSQVKWFGGRIHLVTLFVLIWRLFPSQVLSVLCRPRV